MLTQTLGSPMLALCCTAAQAVAISPLIGAPSGAFFIVLSDPVDGKRQHIAVFISAGHGMGPL